MRPLFALVESDSPHGAVPLKVGGTPDWVAPAVWPKCKTCGNPLSFVLQLSDRKELPLAPSAAIYLFLCEDEALKCRPFDPEGGANAVIAQQAAGGKFETPKAEGVVHAQKFLALAPAAEDSGALDIDFDSASSEQLREYDRAQEAAPEARVGGAPAWLQGPERLKCAGKPELVAQIAGEPFGLNFGDGGACFVFTCPGDEARPFRALIQSY